MSIIFIDNEIIKNKLGASGAMKFQLIDGTGGILYRYPKPDGYEYHIDDKNVGIVESLPAMELALRYLIRDRFPIEPLPLNDDIKVHISSNFVLGVMCITYGESSLICVLKPPEKPFDFVVSTSGSDGLSEAFCSLFMNIYQYKDILYTLLKKYNQKNEPYDECFCFKVEDWMMLLEYASTNVDEYSEYYALIGITPFDYFYSNYLNEKSLEGPLFL